MSEKSTAFLAGAAFAGIAAFVLLRTGGNPSQANLPTYLPSPPQPGQPYGSMQQLPPPPPTAAGVSPDTTPYCLQQQSETQRLKDRLEQQQSETEQVKAQLRNQQMVIEALTTQAKANVYPPPVNPTQALPPIQEQQPLNPMLTGILWAVGGMVLTVISGVVLAAAFALLSQQQRPPRTVQVIHPIQPPPPTLSHRRRSEFLPPQLEGRRNDSIDYDR
ncbi:heterocyst differentiation related protein [Trichocoleus sp. DQ-U1]|uniref:heterocyst differentiation related protein n=1 Tax=Trichocoleus sp. DQ-U1 TaxID=2933926 RepID=UPI0032981C26